MGAFFRFLYKFHVVGLFILLELFAFSLMIRQNAFHQAAFTNYVRNVSGKLYEKLNSVSSYMALRETNQTLLRENAILRSRLPEALWSDAVELTHITDSLHRQQYDYMSADVVNNTVNKQYNYITLNRGRLHGVEPDMAVVSSEGIVGIVNGVSDHYATAISLLNRDFRVSARLKSSDHFGALKWDEVSFSHADLNDIPHHAKLQQGDTVVTSGLSPIFPEGILIGTVSSFQIKDGNFFSIKVDLSTDFKKLKHVTLIKNYLREEQLNLEKLTER
ncbi:MAG: rod shape-determining protein MreC [Bacteroidales bacterium]